jgi:hypothetical protein
MTGDCKKPGELTANARTNPIVRRSTRQCVTRGSSRQSQQIVCPARRYPTVGILYEMTSGTRPFGGASGAELMSGILSDTPRPVSAVRRDAPAELRRAIDGCLQQDARARFQRTREIRTTLETPRAAGPEGPSVAVLPFVNMSADPENAYFSDGLSEEIINALTKLPGLRVIARRRHFAFAASRPA